MSREYQNYPDISRKNSRNKTKKKTMRFLERKMGLGWDKVNEDNELYWIVMGLAGGPGGSGDPGGPGSQGGQDNQPRWYALRK